MYDDDFYSNLLNKYSSTTTTQEQQTDFLGQETYRPQQDFSNTGMSFDSDQDYSSTQNFTEQTSYEGHSQNVFEEPVQETFEAPSLNAPIIYKEQPAVNLIKKRAKLILETRMKIVIAVFMVIVACLSFISIFNFVEANRIQSTFADKQIEINNLKQSITDSQATYTLVNDDEYLKLWAESNEFVDTNETNTIVVDISKFYEEEPAPEKIESNWFNDVCEFLSSLFA